jgi:hypothetical protein
MSVAGEFGRMGRHGRLFGDSASMSGLTFTGKTRPDARRFPLSRS